MNYSSIKSFKCSIENELFNNILPFWMSKTIDRDNGGLFGMISNDNSVHSDAPRGSIMYSRFIWTFASAYRLYGNGEYLEAARHAYDYFIRYFTDSQNGGVVMQLDSKGKTIDDRKFLYVQAFAIYGLSEFFRATGFEESLDKAIGLFNDIEKHCHDDKNGGYLETFTRDWNEHDDLVLGDRHMNEKKSMNAHLHLMEAYTNLYRVWKNELLHNRLKELIELSLKYIIDCNTFHLNAFFDENWTLKSHSYTYGHDIETSWLLFEAAEVLGDSILLKKCHSTSINMAIATYEQGIDKDGGLFYEADENGVFDFNKEWWPQAEAVVGFVNAWQLTGEDKFFTAAENCWKYILENLIDKANGEWFWGKDKDGKLLDKEKAGPWKCPYHNGRACMEVLQRLKKTNNI